jgi:hypothetical protein
MTGDAFESTVSFAAAMLGNHAVAAFMVAIASFMAVLFAASGVAKKGGVA